MCRTETSHVTRSILIDTLNFEICQFTRVKQQQRNTHLNQAYQYAETNLKCIKGIKSDRQTVCIYFPDLLPTPTVRWFLKRFK